MRLESALHLLCLRLALAVFGAWSSSCTTPYRPLPLEEVPFQSRIVTQSEGNVHVSAAVLSAEESKQVFATDLYERGIQPVWIEIDNRGDLRVGDIVMGKISSRVVNHCGILVAGGLAISHTEGRLSRKEVVRPWVRRAEYVIRHRSLW